MMAHGPRQENGTGRFYFFGDVPGDGNRDRRYALGLNCTLDQSDGLMADRSSRDQQGRVGLLLHRLCLGDVMGHDTLKPFRIHVCSR